MDPSDIDLQRPQIDQKAAMSLFYPTLRTYVELAEIIKKTKLKTAQPVILNNQMRFSDSRPLGHIEANIFGQSSSVTSAEEKIRIVSAGNRRAEVEFIAAQILELVRKKEFRYRDIAVIASDIETYQHYIRACFEDYRIPFFIDSPKPLCRHPVIQLICSAVSAATTGFSNSEVFAYLKTDLTDIGRGDVDLLENYCIAYGIGPDDWRSETEWNFAAPGDRQFDQKHINLIRREACGDLLELRDRLCCAETEVKILTAEEFTKIIFDFLDKLKIPEKLSQWIVQAQSEKDYETAELHRQFYDRLLEVFDEFIEVFAGRLLTAADYYSIIRSAFSQMQLALIPPTLEEVLVGSIERSRHPDLKAVFLLGATAKQFPAPLICGTILTEQDRLVTEPADFKLADTLATTLADRRYLAYIAFTRASQYLLITYPVTDEDGSSLVRSRFITELELLFEELSEESIAGRARSLEEIKTKFDLAEILAGRLGKDPPKEQLQTNRAQLFSLLKKIKNEPDLTEIGCVVESAINYDNSAKLQSRIVNDLFGETIKCSATRLQNFAQCPYKYFARYSLGLRERKEFKLRPLDLGEFYHRVMDGLVRKLIATGSDLAKAKSKDLLKLLNEQIAKILTEETFIGSFVKRNLHNKFIIDSACEILEDFVLAASELCRAGEFRPAFTEIAFGQAGQDLGRYEIKLSDGRSALIRGKIDRLDIAEIDGEKIGLIFDYKKTTNKTFSWTEFFYGLDMQLAVYMLAAKNSGVKDLVNSIAGAFYLPIESEIKSTAFGKLENNQNSFANKAKGIFNGTCAQILDGTGKNGESKYYNFFVTKEDGQPYGIYSKRGVLRPDDFENFLKFSQWKITELAEKLASGKIDISPYRLGQQSPCSYCEYKALCGFDWRINDYNHLAKTDKSKILEQLSEIYG
jgi:ATP-dependent helicase/nuclease subunit B